MKRTPLDKDTLFNRFKPARSFKAVAGGMWAGQRMRGFHVFETSEAESGFEVEVTMYTGEIKNGILTCRTDYVSGQVTELYLNGAELPWEKFTKMRVTLGRKIAPQPEPIPVDREA